MTFFTFSLLILYSLVAVINLVFVSSWYTLLNLFISAVIVMLPAALFLLVGRLLPKKWFNETRYFFRENKFKDFVCKITNVKSWKDKIPVGAKVNGNKMDKLANPKDVEYLNGYIYESCFADWLHTSISVWGFLSLIIIAFIDVKVMLTMALPMAIIFLYQNMASVTIQWLMRPRIVKYRDLLQKRMERENKTKIEEK